MATVTIKAEDVISHRIPTETLWEEGVPPGFKETEDAIYAFTFDEPPYEVIEVYRTPSGLMLGIAPKSKSENNA